MDLKERFLKYVSYDTQSSEESTTFPSTEKQKVLLAALRDEMEALGMTEVTMDQYGYVMPSRLLTSSNSGLLMMMPMAFAVSMEEPPPMAMR